jgi:Na+(H+)/acetate symporter ActP
MCAHLILYAVAFGLSMTILRVWGGMDGIANNNFLGYFLLHFLYAPACILLGIKFWNSPPFGNFCSKCTGALTSECSSRICPQLLV